MNLRTFAIGAALLLLSAGSSAGQGVKLEFSNGRVTLLAQNAPARAILAEWARLGGTRIVNGDRIAGPPVTIELSGVTEREALDIVLRGVAGYMMTARQSGTGASQIDRIMILPTSTPPRAATAPAPTPVFGAARTVRPVDDDQVPVGDEPEDAAVAPNRPTAAPRPVLPVVAGTQNPNGAVVIQNGVPQTFVPPTPAPAPQTGASPAAPRPGNPFNTLPGSSRPGEVTPPPPQDNRNNPNGAPVPQER